MAKRSDRAKSQKKSDPRPEPPVVDLDAEKPEGEKPVALPQIKLFTYDGKDYYMAQPAANLMLKMLWKARTDGMIGAIADMLIELIGEDTYQVLMNIEDLEPKELSALMDRVMHFATDRMEAVLGNF